MWVTYGTRVKGFTISEILPVSSRERDDDYGHLLSNVILADTGGTRSINIVPYGLCAFWKECSTSDVIVSQPDCIDAVKDELDGLIKRQLLKIVEKRQLPSNGMVMGGRIISSVKNEGTGAAKFKARLVLPGHRDPEKALFLHDSCTKRAFSG